MQVKKHERISLQCKNKKGNLHGLRKYTRTKEMAKEESCVEEGIGAKGVTCTEKRNYVEGIYHRVKQ